MDLQTLSTYVGSEGASGNHPCTSEAFQTWRRQARDKIEPSLGSRNKELHGSTYRNLLANRLKDLGMTHPN